MGQSEIAIYTDGACSPNPGSGGWAAVFVREDKVVRELSGQEEDATNNRMELTAALRALQSLPGSSRIILITDSSYLKNGITQWIHSWKRRGWLTAAREPVKNRDLWEALEQEMRRHQITWQWVRGHSRNRWNERADQLAVAARQQADGVEQSRAVSQIRLPQPDCINRVCMFLGITFSPVNGRGSWAAVLVYQGHVRAIGGARAGRSANEIYLFAAVQALLLLKRRLPVTLYTTSAYLCDGMTRWLDGWQRRDWQTSNGRPVSNVQLWRKLATLRKTYGIKVVLAKRKNGYCLLQEAKELAREYG